MPVRAALLLACLASFVCFPDRVLAQGETTSAIVGTVLDPSEAALADATVTIISTETGFKRSVRTDDGGRFSFPQLKPGSYTVKVEAEGFELQTKDSVFSGLGQKQTVNFILKLTATKGEVTVVGEGPLVNPENPNTATTLSAPALENLPNPGGDMTYPLQFAPGALINTAGSGNDFVGGTNGYGNVQFNGLPSLSNGYIVDGLETNDPLTNLNSGLSTNLVLGLNSIAEVTVNTISYSVDQGRYGASQVNYVTKSGTNQFHGNLYELWNGSMFNAANFFTNATPGNHKPRSTVNHFGGSLGGPIRRNKLFFFFDSEWVRIALPIVSATTVPTPAFQNYVLKQLPQGGTDAVTGSAYLPAPELVPFYQQMFSLYRSTAGTPLAVLGCPFNGDGRRADGSPPNGNGCANRQTISHSSDDHEQVQTVRIDYNIDERNTTWFRFQADTGLQAAYTDPINPLFDAISSQPLYSFAAGYTRILSAKLVNYFNPAFSWYESLFGPADFQKTLSAFPIVLQGNGANAPFTTMGGLNNTWVQGRRAARFFINDNLAWTIGAHELRFGTNTRIFRLNDYDFGEGVVPLVTYTTLPQFIYGVASTASKTFPLANSQPYNFLNLDLYAQDTWKLTPKLTWTFGIRATHNSNPLNPHYAVARLPGSFDSISHDVNQPLERRYSDRSWKHLRHDAARDLTAADSHCLAGVVQNGPAERIRSLFRYPAGQRSRSRGCQSSVLPDLSRRSAGNRRRDGDRAGSTQQRNRRDSGRESGFQRRLCRRATLVRIAAIQSDHLSAAGGDHRRAGRQAARALFHAVELRPRTASRQHDQSASSVCWHARCEPAVHHSGERLSDGLRGVLCAVRLTADRLIRDSEPLRSSTPAPTATTTACRRQPRSGSGTGFRSRRTTPGATAWTRFPTADSCRFPLEEFSRRFPAIWSGIAALATMMCGTTSLPATSISCRSR